MIDEVITGEYPSAYARIKKATEECGFLMASEVLTCSLLKTLAASKPSSKFLELGTGTGLATAWILDGMDEESTLISVDNDEIILNIAKENLGTDKRLQLVCADGGEWIKRNANRKFSYIFADTWHGKFLMLDEALNMLEKGGLYIIDDLLPQLNWGEGHSPKVAQLLNNLEKRDDVSLTRLNWASGIAILVKK